MLKLQTPKGVFIAFLVTIAFQTLNFIQIKQLIRWHFNCGQGIYNICLALLSYTLGTMKLDDGFNHSIKMCLQNLYVYCLDYTD